METFLVVCAFTFAMVVAKLRPLVRSPRFWFRLVVWVLATVAPVPGTGTAVLAFWAAKDRVTAKKGEA